MTIDCKLTICKSCGYMTKSIPKGLGRSYGYGCKCFRCGANKMQSHGNKKLKFPEWQEHRCRDKDCKFCKEFSPKK